MRGDLRTIIGRMSERAALERFLEEVGRGPAGILLEGEVGIGKTELLREGVRAAVGRSYSVLACRPDDFETSLAYAALGDLLEPQLGAVESALAPLRRQALETALLRGEAGKAADRRAVSLAVVDALRVLTARSPVLIAVDDLQWLDGSSAHVLRFALRRLDHDRLGLLATRRPTADGELESAIALTGIERLRIEPLGEDELDAVLRARLGVSFLRATLRRLHTSSGGNPLFALELARALQRGSKLPLAGEPLTVPETLRNLVWERLAGLPEDVRRALLVVAARSQATVGVLEEVVGSRERTVAQLGTAVEAGVLEVDRGRLRFAHPLLREVLYAEAGGDERRRVHRRLAQVVRNPEEQARHLGLATELPDAEVAAVLEEASRRAGARGAPDAAASFAEQAFRLTPAELRRDALRRAVATSDYLWDSGETGRARRQLDELAATLPPGEDRARVLRRLARAEAYERGFEPVVSLLERARVEAGGSAALRAAVERDLGLALTQLGKLRRAESHARAAVRLAEAAGRAGLLDDARATLDTVRFMLGRGPPADLRERAAAPLEGDDPRQERQPTLLQRSLTWAAMLKWTDDFDAAREALERLQTHVSNRQEEALLFPVLFHLGELECWAGNFESARRWAMEMKTASVRASQPGLRAQSLYLEALVESLVGQVDEARAHGLEGLRLAEEADDARVAIRQLKVLGTLDLSLGEPARAERRLTEAIERSMAAGYGDPGFFRLEADAIEALTATGQLDRAEQLLVKLERRGKKLGRGWALATGGRCRALLASARGDPAAALVAVERSLQEHAGLAEPVELGRTLLVDGMLRRRAKQKRLARASLENALEIFQQLGAPLWAVRARAELARISGRAPAPGALTQTERRVAELVAAGRANKEVAAELYLSVKAVEANLSKIYRKLEVRSRTELAARLAKP